MRFVFEAPEPPHWDAGAAGASATREDLVLLSYTCCRRLVKYRKACVEAS
jgi:hypothetical protein